MRKFLCVCGSCICAAFICLAGYVTGLYSDKLLGPAELASAEQDSGGRLTVDSGETKETALHEAGEVRYLVKEYQGKLGIFTDSRPPRLYSVIGVRFDDLTEYDKTLFSEGVWVNEEELAMLMEDFLS